jgi:ABC-2 type transport system ATP-binding protein
MPWIPSFDTGTTGPDQEGGRLLEFRSVSQRFGSTKALTDVDLSLNERIVGLVGVNGAGKSTLMKLGIGQIGPTHGSVVVDGEPPSTHAGRIGYRPQEVHLPGHFTCTEFLGYLAWLRKVPRKVRRQQARHALDAVNLGDVSDHRISTLSGGMRRRLTIAQALVGRPSWILLDEPTTGLDPEQRASIRALLDALSASHMLVSSHIIEDVAAMADRVIFLHGGRVVLDTPSTRGRDPRELEELFLHTIMRVT